MMLRTAGPMTAMNRVGRMQKISGIGDLDGDLLGLLLRPLAPLDAHLVGLDPQDLGDRDAERVGLHHGADEAADVGDVGALAERTQRVGTALPDLHLAEHPGELLGQRALGVAGHLLDRGVEARARTRR